MAENKTIAIIIAFAVALLLIGILLPIGLEGLTDYTGFYNVTTGTVSVTGTNTNVGTLVNTILPVLIVIAIIMAFVGAEAIKRREN